MGVSNKILVCFLLLAMGIAVACNNETAQNEPGQAEESSSSSPSSRSLGGVRESDDEGQAFAVDDPKVKATITEYESKINGFLKHIRNDDAEALAAFLETHMAAYLGFPDSEFDVSRSMAEEIILLFDEYFDLDQVRLNRVRVELTNDGHLSAVWRLMDARNDSERSVEIWTRHEDQLRLTGGPVDWGVRSIFRIRNYVEALRHGDPEQLRQALRLEGDEYPDIEAMQRTVERYRKETQLETLSVTYRGVECRSDDHYECPPWGTLFHFVIQGRKVDGGQFVNQVAAHYVDHAGIDILDPLRPLPDWDSYPSPFYEEYMDP